MRILTGGVPRPTCRAPAVLRRSRPRSAGRAPRAPAGRAARAGSPGRRLCGEASIGIARASPRAASSARPDPSATTQRAPDRERLQRGDRVRLEGAQQDDEVGARERGGHHAAVAGGDRADVHAAGDPERGGKVVQFALVGPGARDPQARARLGRQHLRECGEHALVALVLLQAPDGRDQRRPARERAEDRAVARGLRQVDPVGDQREALAREAQLARVLVDLERRDGDERGRRARAAGAMPFAGRRAAGGAALEECPPPWKVTTNGMPARAAAAHRQRRDERVVGLDVDDVPRRARRRPCARPARTASRGCGGGRARARTVTAPSASVAASSPLRSVVRTVTSQPAAAIRVATSWTCRSTPPISGR